MASINDYLSRIIPEHQGQPEYEATISLSIQPLVDAVNLLESFPALFDLDNAVGQQLDFTGQWIGLSRYLNQQIEAYFSFDVDGLGWDQGTWYQGTWAYSTTFTTREIHTYFSWDTEAYDLQKLDIYLSFDTLGQGWDESQWFRQGDPIYAHIPNGNPYSLGWDEGLWYRDGDPLVVQVPSTLGLTSVGLPGIGPVALDDTTYRLLLRAKVLANQWDGTIPGAVAAFNAFFNPEGFTVIIQDGQPQVVEYFTWDDPIRGWDEDGWYPDPPGYANGSMVILIALLGQMLPNALIFALFTLGLLDLKTAGVGIVYYVTQSVPNAPLFGFDAETNAVGGWDQGGWGLLTIPS